MMTSRSHSLATLALTFLIGPAADLAAQPGPNIPFAPIEDTTLKDADNPAKKFRVDFARVENDFPLTRQHLMRITPQNIANLTQEQVDQIYGRLTAGPIPDGQYAGNLFFARGDRIAPQIDLHTRLEQILGGLEGRLAGNGIEVLEEIGRKLWKGKVFFRDQRILRNMIENTPVIQLLTDDPNTVQTTTVPRQGPLGKLLGFQRDTVWLLFPAKLYCGQSLLDGRRESIIVDYNYSDEIEGYRASPDSLGGRGGLRIRDEIRMIRPGFYLGRAYTNRMFLLNFTLYNDDVAKAANTQFVSGAPVRGDCWDGEQGRKAPPP
jgi:hypothetical protein